MARETDYQVLYKATADFSALAREAAKAKAILKAMREEEEKANKVSLQDQDRITKAREKARKALEAQNMAATTSARISREMAERGKREAESVRALAKESEVASRQITKLANAYKRLNAASSGDSSSGGTARSISDKTSFAEVSSRELEKVKKNLDSYMSSARDTSDTNTRLSSSLKRINLDSSEAGDILARLSMSTKKLKDSTSEVTVETKNFGNVIETTTRRVHNAGTEHERVSTTIRRVTKETKESSNVFVRWAANIGESMGRAWRDADRGASSFTRLRRAMFSGGGGGGNDNFWNNLTSGASSFGKAASGAIGVLARLPRVIQLAIGIAVIFEPAVAVLGSLGAAALGAANNLAALSGVLAAVPGLIAAAGTAVAAMMVAFSPVKNVLQQYRKAQQESEDATSRASKSQTNNSAAIRSAVSGVRTAINSLKTAQNGVVEANQRLGDANLRLIDSHKELKKAQEDVGKSARDAKRELEDLRDTVRGSADDEESANIALARAKEDLAKVNSDLYSSDLDRREAALRVRQAEDELNDVRERNKRNREDLTEAEKKGIKGSDQVVAANERVASAQRGIIDAERGVADAQRGVAAARVRVADAEMDVADARQRLTEAYKGTGSAASAATTQQDRYQKMLAKLSPATREVVKGILSMDAAWKSIQRDTGESFFKRIAGDMGLVKGLLPTVKMLLTDAADALGEVAHKGILMLASGPWKADFKTISKDNAVLIRNMGEAGLSVADAFRHITVAAGPFTKWVTAALKEGADHFAKWSKGAREDGSIGRFLDNTKDRMQQMWQITKNVLATLASWNTASNDFGKWTLDRLEAMTKRWRDVADAQKSAGSPLKKYLEDVRPLLSAIGSLLGAVVKGLADISSDPKNMATTISLLRTLQEKVLPPLLNLLNELNDAGIAVVVAEALGKIFDAFSKFLDSGGGRALRVFIDTFSTMVGLFLEIATMPVLGPILGQVAAGLALVAGVLIAAKFTMLFRIIDGFRWIIANGKLIAARFRGIGDGIATTTTTTTTGPGAGTPLPVVRPSGGIIGTVTRPTPISSGDLSAVQRNVANGFIGTVTRPTMGAADLAAVQRNVANYAKAAEGAATRSGFFARSLDGVKTAAAGMRGGMGSLTSFLGGPWGVALVAATIALTYFYTQQSKVAAKAKEYESALSGFGTGAGSAAGGVDKLSAASIKASPELAAMVTQLTGLGLSAGEIEDAFNGSAPAVEKAISRIDKAIKDTKDRKIDSFLVGDAIGDRTFNKGAQEKIEKLETIKKALQEHRISNEEAAAAVKALGIEEDIAAGKTENYTEKTQASADTTHAANFAQSVALEKSTGLEGVLKVLGDTTSTTSQRFEALRTATDLLYGDQISATEASENFNRKLLELKDTVKVNGTSLDEHSLKGLNNRDALQAAAGAAKDETLMLIASGVPYDVAIKKHKERIDKLKEEAGKSGLNTTKAAELIEQYGKIPPAKTTKVTLDGFDAVYQHLRELQFAQWALSQGLTPEQAAAAWKRNEAIMKGGYQSKVRDNADKQKYAGGGAVFGPGSKTSDDIDAKLSNGEFVHKAASVDYYGTDLMYALNNKMIDKNVLKAARQVNSFKDVKLDPEFASGGKVQGFASGGEVMPFPVSMAGVAARTNKLYANWKSDFNEGLSGSGDGSIGGWQHMWKWVKARFPFTSLMSAFRPGDPLYHGKGKAIDIGVPDKFGTGRWWNVFRGIKGSFFKNIAELIWDFAGNKAVWNGKEHFFHGPKSGPGTHRNHIHWAMKKPSMAYTPGSASRDNADRMKFADGGLADMFNFSGLSSPSMPSVPRTNPSALSQAAKSVVNNSNTNSGMNFGDIIIHNPAQERGGDSIRNSLLRTATLFDGP